MNKILFPPTLLPFTYPWIIRMHIKGNATLLDVGCGDGKFLAHVLKREKIKEVYGVDLFEPYINKAKKTKIYNKIFQKDVRKIRFPKGSFEIVLASQVVEHFKKGETLSLIKNMEKIASKKIIIGTPNGYFPRGEFENNKLQKHLSSWYPEDFRRLGYKVYGQSVKLIYGKKRLLDSFLGKFIFIRIFLFILSYLLSPFTYYFPDYAAHLIAVKEFKKGRNH